MGDPVKAYHLDGLVVAGEAVVLTGRALDAALQAAGIANRTRRVNGAPPSPAYLALAAALNQAKSVGGHPDVREPVGMQRFSHEHPAIPIVQAAQRLGLCERQVRRLAPRLGGRKVGGRWFVDERALDDYEEEMRMRCLD